MTRLSGRPGPAEKYVSDTAIFEAVADALVRVGAPGHVKTEILSATMDVTGVCPFSAERYGGDPAIVALFATRGVTFVAEAPAGAPSAENES